MIGLRLLVSGASSRCFCQPATVVVIELAWVCARCARALMRAGIWTEGDRSVGLPTPGEILAEMTRGEEGGAPYDAAWGARAAETMW